MNRSALLFFASVLINTIGLTSIAQTKIIRGIVKDGHSEERIPFASVQLKQSGAGGLTDSAGNFSIRLQDWSYDTLEVTYVGYQLFRIPIDSALISKSRDDIINFNILLERGQYAQEVVVRRKIDRGLLMWRRIVRRKPYNDRYRFSNFSYELYNKLELDLKNINRERLTEMRLMKPFKFIFDNVDTTDGTPILPVYLTESISDYYYQKSPLKRREIIKASKTIGVNNESVSKLLGGMDQVVNFYSNFIPVFDKEFVSPVSDNGDAYYKYNVADTQVVGGRRLIHVTFYPRRKGENTFEGDFWVHDTTFAIQKMNLRLNKDANINYVDKLSLIQEYSLIKDSTWFLSKDKFVVDIAPLGKTNLAFIGKKTTTYRDVIVNNQSVVDELSKNRILEEVIVPRDAREKNDQYWSEGRHEELTRSEQGVYEMIDTLMKMPAFKKYTNAVYFLTVGYKNIGNYEIGPWFNWMTYNVQEGYRLRFDLGTNKSFSDKIFLHGYLAYGFTDQQFKYKVDGKYFFSKHPRSYISGAYSRDIDYGQSYYDEISQDNIFALAIRKAGVPIKFLMVEEKRIELFKEWNSGLSATFSGNNKIYDPLRNLPPKEMFGTAGKSDIISTEASVRLRYAYLEKFLESTFNRISLGSPYPIVELKFTKGINGIANSGYDYTKFSGSVSSYKKIPPFGNIYYNVFGGRTYGTLPYMMLDLAPGNEIYYYNRYAFNLMNRFEYLHDRYAGVNFEHNIGGGIFRFIPFIKKLKLRQFYTAKSLWGTLSQANRQLNMPAGSEYRFESLDGRTYLELGTGVDNIFRLFRIDLVWRVLPSPLPPEGSRRFGVFGSFRVGF